MPKRRACSFARRCAALLVGVLLLAGACRAATLDVIYPSIAERPPEDYGFQVLKLALQESGVPFSLRLSRQHMNTARALAEIEAGRVSVIDVGTSAAFEQRFRAVYFPIDLGLSGYRLFIIRKDQAADFARIRTLAELRHKVAGQGTGWADATVLEAAGLPVVTAEFEQLFRMVNAGRFDYFPLGVEEVHGLLERYRAVAPECMVEQHLVLHYPFGRLFFVARDNVALHDALLRGLQRALADGSLARTLQGNPMFAEGLAKADLKHRVRIEIDNPYLTPRFREIPARDFLQP